MFYSLKDHVMFYAPNRNVQLLKSTYLAWKTLFNVEI